MRSVPSVLDFLGFWKGVSMEKAAVLGNLGLASVFEEAVRGLPATGLNHEEQMCS